MPSTEHNNACECEHIAHFPDALLDAPHVPVSHAYGAAAATRSFQTPYGTFSLCALCAQGHMLPYIQEAQDA